MFNNPAKRIRLDSNQYGNENDDFAEWDGDDVITAEEFDRMEFQATQQVRAAEKSFSNLPQPQISSNISTYNSIQTEEMKQHQYELEGKVKLLSDSVEKLNKSLIEEKLNRDKIINNKVEIFEQKENLLQKEIKRLETVLQFKEQEMKAVYGKMNVLKNELSEKKESFQPPERPSGFLKKFKFDVAMQPSTSKLPEPVMSCRKYKLHVKNSRGQTQGSDFLSSVLCNKLVIPAGQNPYFSRTTNIFPETPPVEVCQFSAFSIARISSGVPSEELLDHFAIALDGYLSNLRSFAVKSAARAPSSSSPSLLKTDLKCEQNKAVSSLKDLAYFVSSPQFAVLIQKLMSAVPHSAESALMVIEDTPPAEAPLYRYTERHGMKKVECMLQLLLRLTNPNTYPSGFSRRDEIEWCLCVLLLWSSSSPESLLLFAKELPFATLLKSSKSVASFRMILRLITNLCTHKDVLPLLTHQNDVCVICSIGLLIFRKICASPTELSSVMLSVEDFISTCIVLYDCAELQFHTSPCLTLIIEGLTSALSKYCSAYEEEDVVVTSVLKKGFALLHLLSRYTPDFKERRAGFEDLYVSLVCGMLALCKESPAFKEFSDLVHDLWDFQDDTTELDADDSSEDSVQSADDSTHKQIIKIGHENSHL